MASKLVYVGIWFVIIVCGVRSAGESYFIHVILRNIVTGLHCEHGGTRIANMAVLRQAPRYIPQPRRIGVILVFCYGA